MFWIVKNHEYQGLKLQVPLLMSFLYGEKLMMIKNPLPLIKFMDDPLMLIVAVEVFFPTKKVH